MATKKNTQRKLFSLYARNFSFYEPDYQGIFICPLCFKGFTEDAIDDGLLSIEHVVPSSLGGKLLTLTCRQCNNHAGSQLESHLKRRIEVEDSLQGVTGDPLRGKFQIKDAEFTGDLLLTPEKYEIAALRDLSNPVLHDKAVPNIEEGIDEIHFNINFGYALAPSNAAVLRSAYLLMFYYFGYGYVRFSLLDSLRQLFLKPADNPDLGMAYFPVDSAPVSPPAVSILRQPSELRAFYVLLDFSTAVERLMLVPMPGLEPSGFDIYDRVFSLAGHREPHFTQVPIRHEYVADPRFKDFLIVLWRQLCA